MSYTMLKSAVTRLCALSICLLGGQAHAAEPVTLSLEVSAHERTGHSDWNTAVSVDARGNTYVVFNDEELRVICVKIDRQRRVTRAIVSSGVSDDPGHNTPSVAVDGDGYIHVWYGMHNDEMKLKKSMAPYRVDAGWVREPGPWSGRYTYPAASVGPEGDIWLSIRRRQDWACELYHYDVSRREWRNVASFAQADGYTCYLPRPYSGEDGKVHLSFQWRKGGPGGNRHLGSYAAYDADTNSFSRADGVPYSLPITPSTADVYQPLEASWSGESGISDHGITVNRHGQPVVVYNFYRRGDPTERVLRVAQWDGRRWSRTDIAGPAPGNVLGDGEITNRDGRLSVFYNDPGRRLAWSQSIDGGAQFTAAQILDDAPVSSPWIHVGPRQGARQEPVLVCNRGLDTTCKVIFVPYGP